MVHMLVNKVSMFIFPPPNFFAQAFLEGGKADKSMRTAPDEE